MAFTDGIELPDLLELDSGSYVAAGIKAFTGGVDLYVSIKPVFPGDDSIEIITGIYMDFRAVPRYGRAPLRVRFINMSSEFLTNWLWDFGDGTSGIAYDPEHTYRFPGRYDVKLSARLYPDTYSITKRN